MYNYIIKLGLYIKCSIIITFPLNYEDLSVRIFQLSFSKISSYVDIITFLRNIKFRKKLINIARIKIAVSSEYFLYILNEKKKLTKCSIFLAY